MRAILSASSCPVGLDPYDHLYLAVLLLAALFPRLASVVQLAGNDALQSGAITGASPAYADCNKQDLGKRHSLTPAYVQSCLYAVY